VQIQSWELHFGHHVSSLLMRFLAIITHETAIIVPQSFCSRRSDKPDMLILAKKLSYRRCDMSCQADETEAGSAPSS
jgi:hypothetical protein